MHPSEAHAYEWDEGNEDELARHRIDEAEVMQVFDGSPVWVPNRKHRSGDWKMMGLTTAGRRLTIVLRWYEDRRTVRAITGWDSTDGERTRYFGGR